ncbi:hypothetical protein EG329_003120 [Mollisiaceae sp. DMI_Dod_QoI]|nr:hypothetical protein EG329_003120 [Helotiales sp. DMI_Dod_QoI]
MAYKNFLKKLSVERPRKKTEKEQYTPPPKILTAAEERDQWLREISAYEHDASFITQLISLISSSGKYPTIASILAATHKIFEDPTSIFPNTALENELFSVLGANRGQAFHWVKVTLPRAKAAEKKKEWDEQCKYCCEVIEETVMRNRGDWMACGCVEKRLPVGLWSRGNEARDSLMRTFGEPDKGGFVRMRGKEDCEDL